MPAEISIGDFSAAVLQAIEGGVAQYVATLAFRIEETAKDNLHVGYGVDTGAMQQSISAITARESHYAANVAAAAEMNPDAVFAPEVDIAGPLEAAVQVPAGYSGLMEFGTTKTTAQPFFTPAVEIVTAQSENIAHEVAGL